MPTFQLETVTPQIVKPVLETQNEENFRNLDMATARKYAAIMKRGDWMENPVEMVAFGWDNQLLNGQHTYMAVLLSGTTQRLWTARNVDPKVTEVLDGNRPRRSEDDFIHEGDDRPGYTAAALNLWLWYESGSLKSATSRKDRQALLRAYRANPEMEASLDIAERLVPVYCARKQGPKPVGAWAFLHYVVSRIDKQAADEFFRQLTLPDGLLPENSPVLAFKQVLIGGRANSVRTLVGGGARSFFHAWNRWRDGLTLRPASIDPTYSAAPK